MWKTIQRALTVCTLISLANCASNQKSVEQRAAVEAREAFTRSINASMTRKDIEWAMYEPDSSEGSDGLVAVAYDDDINPMIIVYKDDKVVSWKKNKALLDERAQNRANRRAREMAKHDNDMAGWAAVIQSAAKTPSLTHTPEKRRSTLCKQTYLGVECTDN